MTGSDLADWVQSFNLHRPVCQTGKIDAHLRCRSAAADTRSCHISRQQERARGGPCGSTESFAAVPEPPTSPQGFDKFVETLTTMFPVWVRSTTLHCI